MSTEARTPEPRPAQHNPLRRSPKGELRSDDSPSGELCDVHQFDDFDDRNLHDDRNTHENRNRQENRNIDDDDAGADAAPDDETVDLEIIEEPEAGGESDLAARDGEEKLAPGKAELAPLFSAENTADYRARWDVVQRGFVDDPARAVREGDALLSEVINALARTFADERSSLEQELSRKTDASTEALRRALQRHRAFFERLLSV